MHNVTGRRYRLMYLYPTISDGKQILLKYNKLAVDALESYAVLGNCLSIGNTTVCQEKGHHKLVEESCIPQLVNGGHAACDYVRNDEEVFELVDDGTIFLTHFNGTVATTAKNYYLEKSFIAQYDNETITVGNRNYSSYSSTHLMAMPAVLTQITATGYQLSMDYIHDFNPKNLQKLSNISTEILIFYLTEVDLEKDNINKSRSCAVPPWAWNRKPLQPSLMICGTQILRWGRVNTGWHSSSPSPLCQPRCATATTTTAGHCQYPGAVQHFGD